MRAAIGWVGLLWGLPTVALAQGPETADQRDEAPAAVDQAGGQGDAPLSVREAQPEPVMSAWPGPSRSRLLDLPRCVVPLDEAMSAEALAPPGPDSDAFVPFAPVDQTALEISLTAFATGEVAEARVAADAAGYLLCRLSEAPVGVWTPRMLGEGRAAFAWRLGAATPLIVGAPHPHFESGTRRQALLLFEGLGARALVVSGTHRCAASEASECSGTTRACSDDLDGYRISDMAHTEDSAFQLVHQLLAAQYPDDWVVSLHGMADDGISLSDGTTGPLVPGSAAWRLLLSLQVGLPDEALTACNDQELVPVDPRLCGTTNAQGRAVNHTPDACAVEATASTGRFVHLEQSKAVRARPEAVLEAFRAALGRP